MGRSQLLTGPCLAEFRGKKHRLQEKLPSLYPSYLPYRAQHLILNTAQQILEESCFDFAMTSVPSLLQERKWECAAAGELTQWTKIFRSNRAKPWASTLGTDFGSGEARGMLTAVSNLRHTAVHRLPTTARGVSQLLESAVKLMQVLEDGLRAAQLEELWSDVNSKIKSKPWSSTRTSWRIQRPSNSRRSNRSVTSWI